MNSQDNKFAGWNLHLNSNSGYIIKLLEWAAPKLSQIKMFTNQIKRAFAKKLGRRASVPKIITD
jgi:hypothetical protein